MPDIVLCWIISCIFSLLMGILNHWDSFQYVVVACLFCMVIRRIKNE